MDGNRRLHKATEDYSDPNRRWHKAKIKPRNFIENIKLQINNTNYEIQTTSFQKLTKTGILSRPGRFSSETFAGQGPRSHGGDNFCRPTVGNA